MRILTGQARPDYLKMYLMEQTFLRINEIFYSIQGESTWVGKPCVFLRLTGCPHRCHYCDTSYAFKEGAKRSVESVLDEIATYPTRLVEITGGEPLAQKQIIPVMRTLCDEGYSVLLETSGSQSLKEVDHRVVKIVDIKTPNSGAANSFDTDNLNFLHPHDEVKFVITSREDFEWVTEIAETYNLFETVKAVHCSPVMAQEGNTFIQGCEALSPPKLADWVLASGLPFHCHLQLHKYIWSPTTRGV